jgi:hypothetical protein
MKFSEWLTKEDLTYRAAEKRSKGKLTDAAIWRLANGTRSPSWASLMVILTMTKGEVTPNDFVQRWPGGAKP